MGKKSVFAMNFKGFICSFVFLLLLLIDAVEGQQVDQPNSINAQKREFKSQFNDFKLAKSQTASAKGARFPFSGVEPRAAIDPGIQHWATYLTVDAQFYGVIANLSVHSHAFLKNGQISAAQIWILNDSGGIDKANTVHAGWHVNPELYNDTYTRFFTYWTADSYKSTGCYNSICNGFVLDHDAIIVPGGVVNQVTVGDGPIYYITIKIFKDSKSGDWWLYYGDNNVDLGPVGFWPKGLFDRLADSGSKISIGGTTVHLSGDTGPSMGSGHFPSDESVAAKISNIQFIDRDGSYYSLVTIGNAYVDKSNCYNVGDYTEGVFLYGGPTGCVN